MTSMDFRIMAWIGFGFVAVGLLVMGIMGLVSMAPEPAPSHYQICLDAGGSWDQSDEWRDHGDCYMNGEKEPYGP